VRARLFFGRVGTVVNEDVTLLEWNSLIVADGRCGLSLLRRMIFNTLIWNCHYRRMSNGLLQIFACLNE